MLTKIMALGIVVSGLGLTATGCGSVESLSDEDVEAAVAELETEPGEESYGAEGSPACVTDSDCRTYSSYCGGCECVALGRNQRDPACKGVIVQCFVDPCRDQTAVCSGGQCVLGGLEM